VEKGGFMLELVIAFVLGGVAGYGLRGKIAKESAALVADFKVEVTRLRADLTQIVAEVKAKV
jgi:hypothetical protein